jgi:glycosyltransferase involved in cell wall biosynthesis
VAKTKLVGLTIVNILQMTLAFDPAYGWGGPVRTVYLSCRELVKRGHRVTVYCTNLLNKKQSIMPRTFERFIDGIRVVYFNAWNFRWWPGTVGPIWLPGLKGYIKRELASFDVVHINCFRNIMHIPLVRAAQRERVPFIVQPRGALPIVVNSIILKHLYDRLISNRELAGLSALIALQESERLQAVQHGVPYDLIEIIPNGIDITEREHLPEPGGFRRRYGIEQNQPIILFLARINKKKGTDMLVDAFAKMDQSHDARLVIAGPDDGQLNEVQQMVRCLGLERRVCFTGLLSHQQALEALQDADLFVLPCRTDTFPMAMIEACLTDTPMVITDRCEIAHLVRDRVADVVPFNAALFAKAMSDLLSDRERFEHYKRNCIEVLEDTFSLRAVVDRVEALYQRVVAEGAR